MYSGFELFDSCVYWKYIPSVLVFLFFLCCVLMNGIIYFNVVEFFQSFFSWLVLSVFCLWYAVLSLADVLLCNRLKALVFYLLLLSLIFLQLIFVFVVNYGSNFTFSPHMTVRIIVHFLSQHHFLTTPFLNSLHWSVISVIYHLYIYVRIYFYAFNSVLLVCLSPWQFHTVLVNVAFR